MSQDQSWRNNEPRIRTREEATPSAKRDSRGAIAFAIFFSLLFICMIAAGFASIKELWNARSVTASDNRVAASNHQQPHFTMEELERWYGNWDVDSWNDDLNAVEVRTWGWLDSGKDRGHKEATVCIAPEDYRAMKTVALMKNWSVVNHICRGVRDERAKK